MTAACGCWHGCLSGKALLARHGPLFSADSIASHGKVYTFGFGKHGQVRPSVPCAGPSSSLGAVVPDPCPSHNFHHGTHVQLGHGTLCQSAEPTIVPTLVSAQIVQVACAGAKTYALTARALLLLSLSLMTRYEAASGHARSY